MSIIANLLKDFRKKYWQLPKFMEQLTQTFFMESIWLQIKMFHCTSHYPPSQSGGHGT